MSSDILKGRGGFFKTVLTGIALGAAALIVLMFLFAALVYFFNIDRAYITPLSTLCWAVGCFICAFYISAKTGNKGYLIGAAVGVVTFAAVTAVSLIVSRTGFTLNTLFHFIIIMLASVIGGISGVNKGKNKRII